MKAALVLGLVLGCGGSSPKPVQEPTPVATEPAAPTCVAMADHLTVVMARDGANAAPADVAEIVDVYKLSCGTDGWSDAVRTCYGKIAVETDVEGCGKLLSPEQQASFAKAHEASRQKGAATQDAMFQKFEEFANQACQCKDGDVECAKKVSDDMTKWAEAQPPDGPQIKPDPRIEEVAKRLTECITKAMMPKDEPPPAAPAKAKPKKKAGAK
jgi:hypothetical protein